MTTNQSQRQRMAAFIQDLFNDEIIDGCGLDGGDVQDLLEKHHLVDKRYPKPGSPEADGWGTDDELYYLKPWVRELAKDRDVG